MTFDERVQAVIKKGFTERRGADETRHPGRGRAFLDLAGCAPCRSRRGPRRDPAAPYVAPERFASPVFLRLLEHLIFGVMVESNLIDCLIRPANRWSPGSVLRTPASGSTRRQRSSRPLPTRRATAPRYSPRQRCDRSYRLSRQPGWTCRRGVTRPEQRNRP